MKRYTIYIIMYMALVLLGGCAGQTTGWHTGNVTLVRTLWVDRLPTGGVQTRAFDGAGLTAEGASVAESLHRLGSAGETFVHFGHTERLLLGETFAREDVASLMDYAARNRRIGPAANLWILRGRESWEGAADENVSDRLRRLTEYPDGTAAKLGCSVAELMSAMARRGSVAVPAVEAEGDGLLPAGYAVLRQGRLVGFLDGEQALGLELLRGRGNGQLVEVPLADGADVVLQVKRATIFCEPVLAEGGVQGLRLRCAADLVPTQGEPLAAHQRQAIARQAEVALCGRVAAALACVQLWDADFVGLEQRGRGVCSEKEWLSLDWENNVRTLPLRVTATARVIWPADMAEEYGNE